MNTVVDVPRERGLAGLRANAFGALVMLLLQVALGTWVNLDATVPAADHGANPIVTFGRAVANGPVGLSLHALLGLLLIVSAIAALIRAVRVGQTRWTVVVGAGLASVILASLSGTSFVSSGKDGASLAMALFAVVAMFCYGLILFRAIPQDGRTVAAPVNPESATGASAR